MVRIEWVSCLWVRMRHVTLVPVVCDFVVVHGMDQGRSMGRSSAGSYQLGEEYTPVFGSIFLRRTMSKRHVDMNEISKEHERRPIQRWHS